MERPRRLAKRASPAIDGVPMPGATIYSVAELAGVSTATVSRVLQGSADVSTSRRQRVLDAAAELNYVPLGAARSLAVRHHEAHGLVLPELSGPYYSELLGGFESRAAELGQSITVVLSEGKGDVSAAVRRLATRVDGLAVLGSAGMAADVVRTLHGKKPVVVIAGDPHEGADCVGTENIESARRLTKHLLGHGRRRLLFVGDPEAAPDIRERYAGFAAAHVGAGVGPAAPPVRVSFREADGKAFAERFLAGAYDPDAVMCANDEVALAVMSTLQAAGKDVPGDLAVVGWDNVMAARYIRPGLTTVSQPVRELGALAADRLHARVSGAPARTEPQVLSTQLAIRASCGCRERSQTSRHTPSRK